MFGEMLMSVRLLIQCFRCPSALRPCQLKNFVPCANARVKIDFDKPNCQKELNLVGSGPVVALKPHIFFESYNVNNRPCNV